MPTLIAIIAVCCTFYAIFQVVTSSEEQITKLIWALVLLALPLIGFVIWVVAGPRGKALT